LARHPSLNDAQPGYLNLPETIFDPRGRIQPGWSSVLHAWACRAVDERHHGRRTYIRWFELEVEKLAGARVLG
jgi:hypothetical protein